MNYIEARQLLDKQPLPARPQQAVNELIRTIDLMQGGIERAIDGYDSHDFMEQETSVGVLRILRDMLKAGREAVGA